MSALIPSAALPPVHLLVPGLLLAALVLAFVGVFLLPGVVHWWRLRRLQRALGAFELRTPPGEFRKLFAADARLAHLWKEYQDSLHVQREERDGQLVPVAVRATLPAETFFNGQHVVDARLKTEFFKHLPGIFTGIGIIGTFSGLIDGLRRFQVSDDTALVRASLESLMHSVGQAFLISASAIAAAMLVTFLEKLLLTALYGRTDEIAHAIDARFDAGAGEDYLSRLVQASEDSASQTRTLKDALVSELAAAMREQTDRQIAGLAAPLQQIAQQISQQIAQQIAQHAAQQAAMQNALAQRAEQRHEPRGSSGDGASADSTSAALTDAVNALRTLAHGLTDAHPQTDDARQLRETALAERTSTAVGDMSDLLARAVAEMSGASAQMARSVDALTHATTAALERMSLGANQLGSASQGVASAGDRVHGVMDQAAAVSLQLGELATTMNNSAESLRGGLADHRVQREALAQLVGDLRTTIALARQEAGITAEALARIEQSSRGLGEAQHNADLYLASVSKVLGESHQAFATGMKKTLELANTEFHAKLATAVGLLSSTVVELEATLVHATPQPH